MLYAVLVPQLRKLTGWHPALVVLLIAVPQGLVFRYYAPEEQKMPWWKFGAVLVVGVIALVMLEKAWPMPGANK